MNTHRQKEAQAKWHTYEVTEYIPEAGEISVRSRQGVTSTCSLRTRFCTCEDAKTCRMKNQQLLAVGIEEAGQGLGVECKHPAIGQMLIDAGRVDPKVIKPGAHARLARQIVGFSSRADFERSAAADYS